MNIKRAKEEIKNTLRAYLQKDELGEYVIPPLRQRPILLMGPPGIGKTQIMEQVARECGVGLVSYTITHHTRQSAVGLPFIRHRNFGGADRSVTEYTMSEIIASVYDKMEQTALECKPKLIIGGASAYSREWDYERMRTIADEVGAILWVDMAHTAGLIAAGLLKNPVHYAHIVTSTTHKTLRGPRGGIILMGKDFDDPQGRRTPKGEIKKMSQVLDSYVFPGIQGGPLEHVIAAKAVAFHEALQPEFCEYQMQVMANAKAMAEAFVQKGYKVISGGTDNHLMLIDLRGKFSNLSGKTAERELVKADITVNKNMVPFDSRSAFLTSGLRIGTPAVTTRGFKEEDVVKMVDLIDEVLCSCSKYIDPQQSASADIEAPEHKITLARVCARVHEMTEGRPLNAY